MLALRAQMFHQMKLVLQMLVGKDCLLPAA
jgi:hypothetical protein